jgi:hypothetical protein
VLRHVLDLKSRRTRKSFLTATFDSVVAAAAQVADMLLSSINAVGSAED